MFRYFTTENEIIDNIVSIKGTDARHLKNTLRAQIGDEVAIVTGENEYVSKINEFVDNEIVCNIIYKTDINNESEIDIVLVQGLPKQAKMEDIIQQNVEVGVKKFIPLVTDRCVVKINDKSREDKKLERWRKIAHESSKQSKRSIVPEVSAIMTFNEFINFVKDENAHIIVPYELENSKTIKEALNEKSNKYYIVIGPEGGFEEKEIEKLQNIGASAVTLGKRILRTETAGIVTSSIVLFANDEMGR